MKAFLLYRARDVDPQAELPQHAEELVQDLELHALFSAMAAGDDFLFDVARRTVLASLDDPESIAYRQDILRDCQAHPEAVRDLFDATLEAADGERKILARYFFSKSPELILSRSVQVLRLMVGVLRKVRGIADAHGDVFRSEGFRRFFSMLERELDDDYFAVLEEHLARLALRGGVEMSLHLGKGGKGAGYALRRSPRQRHGWLSRILGQAPTAIRIDVAVQDEAGHQALSELRGRALEQVANALAQSADHVLAFFAALKFELGFYVGCLNLQTVLAEKGCALCIPTAAAAEDRALSADGVYDICLALHEDTQIVGNDLFADGKGLIVITGANQGGKSTFLRSVGQAHLMMLCGMAVAAQAFTGSVCSDVFTHFKRGEDAGLEHGKFDEELGRMTLIVNRLRPGALLLLNESFASTNEREGSEIARQIVRALREAGVKIFFVTHLFDLADGFFREQSPAALFLRATRTEDGRRTFQLSEGRPLPTSYGADLYRKIFSAPRG